MTKPFIVPVLRRTQPPALLPSAPFVWDRSLTIALAREDCNDCRGRGRKLSTTAKYTPCNCVLRNIFSIVLRKYLTIQEEQNRGRSVTLAHLHRNTTGRDDHQSYSRPYEEFCADFILVSRRKLTLWEWRVFELHFLGGGDWTSCKGRLGCNRIEYFRAVYRIQIRLGRAYRELKPHPLWPDYFTDRTL